MFQIAKRMLAFDLNTGTKQRIVMIDVATIKKIIAVFTLSNIPEKLIFLKALARPPNPITKYAIMTIISRTVITHDKRPLFSVFTSDELIINN